MCEIRVITTYSAEYKRFFVLRKSVLLLIWLFFYLFTPNAALACGMPLAARIPSEQALIIFNRGREEIITSVQLLSDKPGAAVIFPVPSAPQVSVLPQASLFSYLAEVTRPKERVEERLIWRNSGEGAGAGAPQGVSVLGQEIVGGYSVARLAADDPGALQRWLDENGYSAPPGAEAILQSYIDEDWKFVAVKLAPDRNADGALEPLRLAFDSAEIVYPMRLGALADQPLDVLLYVLTDRRVEIAGMETHYAGPVAQLDRAPPPELASLFSAPYLTKLRNSALAPAALRDDFVARPATNDEPVRKVVVRTVYVDGWSRMALPIGGLVLALFSSAVAIGFAFGLRRRMDAIAGPAPDEEED